MLPPWFWSLLSFATGVAVGAGVMLILLSIAVDVVELKVKGKP